MIVFGAIELGGGGDLGKIDQFTILFLSQFNPSSNPSIGKDEVTMAKVEQRGNDTAGDDKTVTK